MRIHRRQKTEGRRQRTEDRESWLSAIRHPPSAHKCFSSLVPRPSSFTRRLSSAVLVAALVLGPMPIRAAEMPGAPPEPELLSMDFRETEIGDILRLLAKQYSLNIIIAEDVSGPISVQFSDVSIDEALDAIVTVNGFAYTRRGRVIKVTTPAAAEREPSVTQVFVLKNADVASLRASLEPMLSDVGTIEADTRSNALIVTDTPGTILKVNDVVQRLDSPTPQVMIEARVLETVLNKNEKLGIDWTITASARAAARPVTFPFDNLSSEIAGTNVARHLPVGQTAAESTTTTTATGATSTATETDFPAASAFPFVDEGLFTFGTLSFNQFQAVLQALSARTKTRILANPRVTTLDNQEARIVVGTTVPVPTFVRNETTGEFDITGYQDRQTGIVLRVTPHIASDSVVRMDIHPQVSSIINFVGDPRAQVPVTSTREAHTQVSVGDGQTVVIGGLIDEKDVKIKRSVPFFGDIPLFGNLFRYHDTTREKTDLLIFITAHILTPEKQLAMTQVAVVDSKREELFDEPARVPQEKTLKLDVRGKKSF